MKQRTALLIINPRLGEKITKLQEMIGIFAAAGWKTDIALKEFGGHTQELAKEGAEAGYDLVVACGGDGTLSKVVNGVMASKNRKVVVGVIPAGTANVWAHEIGLPEDPVAACLGLVDSEARKVDLGHIEVEALAIPTRKQGQARAVRRTTAGVQHFVLWAGLGLDAALMRRTSTPAKQKLGNAAIAISAVKEFATHKAFPIQVESLGKNGDRTTLWKGEALQVIVGNTRRYGNIVEATPDAFLDDGVLDVLVITGGNAFLTLQQVLAFVVHRKPSEGASEHFQAARLAITVPASVELHLDGSAMKLKDYLKGKDKDALEAEVPEAALVTYRFEALRAALRLAIPKTYDNALFESMPTKDETAADAEAKAEAEAEAQQSAAAAAIVESNGSVKKNGHRQDEVGAVLEKGRKVTIRGIVPDPAKSGAYIVAGGVSEEDSDDVKPVALRITGKTSVLTRSGEELRSGALAALREGSEVVVEGKESKRGVVRAKRIVVE